MKHGEPVGIRDDVEMAQALRAYECDEHEAPAVYHRDCVRCAATVEIWSIYQRREPKHT